ncbi:hypothetical protein PV325_005787, partial [Microctonus aethiopoides]
KMSKIRSQWKEVDMASAVKKVFEQKMTTREASECFSIPRSTLGAKVKALKMGKKVVLTPRRGSIGAKQRTFTDEQESILSIYVIYADTILTPLSKIEFAKFIYEFAEYLQISHRFNRNEEKAGKEFIYGFMRRHKELKLRKLDKSICKDRWIITSNEK